MSATTHEKSARELADARRAALAEMLRARAEIGGRSGALSENQRGMWFLHQLAPTSAAYNIAFAIRIGARIDVEALRKALQALADRHSMLRTTYAAGGGEPVQCVHAGLSVAFEQEAAAQLDDAALKARVDAVIQEPFDLEHGPVLRARLFTRSDAEHVFLLVVHHIAFDGWSTWLLLDELRALYQAAATNCIASLARPGSEYRDFVRWQTALLAGERGARSRQYWHQQLAGDLPTLDLPTDRPRSRVALARVGASEPFALNRSTVDRVRSLARSEGATLYMALVAAYQIFLHRYTGQEDILVGSPVSGRSADAFSGVVGCFVNSIALRGRLHGSPTCREFFRRTRQTVLEALEHQDYPFRLLTEELRPARDLNHPSLFQTDFALHKPHRFKEIAEIFFARGQTRGQRIDLGGLPIEYYEVHQQGGQLDLSVEMLETGTDVLGVFRYDADLFDRTTIGRMIDHFQIVLDAMATEPDTPISTLPMMARDERQTIVVEWNATAAPFPERRTVHGLFEEQAERTPDAVAVIEPGPAGPDRRTLSYRELNRLAGGVARRLRTLGVGPDVRVGLCLGRSLEMIVGMLGILKAGGAYVPLDPAHPTERLHAMLSDSGASVLLVARGGEARLPRFGGAVMVVDVDGEPAVPCPAGGTAITPASTCLAYVMYTSGSTGRPKGVMIEHRGLVNYVTAAAAEFALRPGDRVLQFASVGFDTAAEEIFPCLATGGTLVLRPQGAAPGVDEFLEASERLGLTVWDLPTAYWHQLVDELARRTLGLPRALRLVILGGERVRLDRVNAWHALAAGRVRLLNTYGPTEATIVAIACELTPDAPCARNGHVPIGRPVKNVRAYVLDSEQQPVPVGVVGELYLGGVGVARGYLHNPEETAARFVRNPVAAIDGSRLEHDRLYRTGDRVRYLSDGNIEFVGRADDQIKIRGVRVELGEIEALLLQHPSVRDAAVVALGESQGDCRIVAHVAGPAGALPAAADLREHLRTRLPAEMIPAAFAFHETLPRTVNNKIDRLALHPPVDRGERGEPSPVPPRTPMERAIADIYAPLLRLDDIGVEDNFFDRGGHSLTAMQAVARMREAFGVPVQVRAIFDMPTIAEMAAHVEALRSEMRDEIEL